MGKAIQDFNIGYFLGRPIVGLGTRCHYNRIVLRGQQRLPRHEGFMMAPCHQQALMEPLVLLLAVRRPTVFLARADIFAKAAARKALTFLKILPIYRMRDGKDNLSKNQEIFDRSRDVILSDHPLCLMAEGRHNNRHQLLPLVKGMFRIAGETQQAMGEKPLYIYPVGIDFEYYERPYSNVCLEVGKPIDIRAFMPTYKDNEPVALNQMRAALTPAIKQLMFNIDSTLHYDEAFALCHLLNPYYRRQNRLSNTAWNRFQMRKRIAQQFDAMEQTDDPRLASVVDLTQQYLSQCQQLNITPHQHAEQWGVGLLLLSLVGIGASVAGLIVSPLFRWLCLFCLACYPISLLPTHRLIHRIIKDSQFRSSINFVARFVLSIIYILLFSILLGCHQGGFWGRHVAEMNGLCWGLLAFITAIILALINRHVQHWAQRLYDNLRIGMLRLTHRRNIHQMEQLKRQLEKLMHDQL